MRTRRGIGLGLLLGLVAGLLGTWPGPAVASCVAPTVSIGVADGASVPYTDGSTVAVHPGDRLVVEGECFRDGCNDYESVQVGCGGPVVTPADEERAMTDVALVVQQGADTRTLGTADAGPAAESYGISFDVRVPNDLAAGPATMLIGPVLVMLHVEPAPTAD